MSIEHWWDGTEQGKKIPVHLQRQTLLQKVSFFVCLYRTANQSTFISCPTKYHHQ